MRKLALTLLAAAMAVAPNAASSQEEQGAAPTADDFVCALSDECPEETTEAQTSTPGGPRVSATRGFSLVPAHPAGRIRPPARPRRAPRRGRARRGRCRARPRPPSR